jgi:two-component system chemotaxis response regulator CheB
MNEPKFVIVIGASAGGTGALSELVAQFENGMDAAVFIVMHLSSTTLSNFLLDRLQPHTSLKCVVPEDGEAIKKNHIYISPSNQHLLLIKNKIVLGNGPEENRYRPSIDVLFRSAAAAYGTRVIGVILTGMLDDGTAGMDAIRRSGGSSIVQDPNEAEYPDMPFSVLDNMEVDHCVSLSKMGEIISKFTKTDPQEKPTPPDVLIESQIAQRVVVDYEHINKLGQKSIYACPDCGGGMWYIENGSKVNRYRCHIGHSYTERDLVVKQGEKIESTLWMALRIMEERRNLLKKMEEDCDRKGLTKGAAVHRKKKDEIQIHVDDLKEILFASQKNV